MLRYSVDVLLEAEGQIPVTLSLQGRKCEGFLVRARQETTGKPTMTLAIQLVDNLPDL